MVSVLALRISATVVHGIAQICTFLRLAYQTRKHRMWLDDGLAALAMVASLVWLACYWIQTDVQGIGPFVQSHLYRLRAYWADSVTFLTVIWLTRICVLLSTIRLAPPGIISRQIPFFACILFAMMWVSLLAQRIFFCVHDRSWEPESEPHCENQTMKLTEVAFELFSDIVLLASPVVTLVTAVVSRKQHRLLLIALCSAIVFASVSVIHIIYQLRFFGNHLEDLTAIIQSGVSLLFSNLPVAIVFIHHRLNPDVEYPDELAEGYLDHRPTMKRTMTIKDKIGFPTTLNSVHIYHDKLHSSFSTSSPHRYVDLGDATSEAAITPSTEPTHEKASASIIGFDDIVVLAPPSPAPLSPYIPSSDPNQPYNVVLTRSPGMLDPHGPYADDNSKSLFRPNSGRSSVSRYSHDSSVNRESTASTYPMLQAELDAPPGLTESVHVRSPMSDKKSETASTYLSDDDPFQRPPPKRRAVQEHSQTNKYNASPTAF